ncbi:hypothetical protein [Weissella confusa]|uniref:hypothetical protein n=1 Tax=Weissella confusa TaxID=1583 RepID=UPI00223C232E|nr:hypothetical protein [Weissella confusa]
MNESELYILGLIGLVVGLLIAYKLYSFIDGSDLVRLRLFWKETNRMSNEFLLK